MHTADRSPGVGAVVLQDEGRPVVIGKKGARDLTDGSVSGDDPLIPMEMWINGQNNCFICPISERRGSYRFFHRLFGWND